MPVGLELIGLTGAQRMNVGVDEARDDRAPSEIDDLRLRAGQGSDLRIGADSHDAIAVQG
jgi:hypothetical protein